MLTSFEMEMDIKKILSQDFLLETVKNIKILTKLVAQNYDNSTKELTRIKRKYSETNLFGAPLKYCEDYVELSVNQNSQTQEAMKLCSQRMEDLEQLVMTYISSKQFRNIKEIVSMASKLSSHSQRIRWIQKQLKTLNNNAKKTREINKLTIELSTQFSKRNDLLQTYKMHLTELKRYEKDRFEGLIRMIYDTVKETIGQLVITSERQNQSIKGLFTAVTNDLSNNSENMFFVVLSTIAQNNTNLLNESIYNKTNGKDETLITSGFTSNTLHSRNLKGNSDAPSSSDGPSQTKRSNVVHQLCDSDRSCLISEDESTPYFIKKQIGNTEIQSNKNQSTKRERSASTAFFKNINRENSFKQENRKVRAKNNPNFLDVKTDTLTTQSQFFSLDPCFNSLIESKRIAEPEEQCGGSHKTEVPVSSHNKKSLSRHFQISFGGAENQRSNRDSKTYCRIKSENFAYMKSPRFTVPMENSDSKNALKDKKTDHQFLTIGRKAPKMEVNDYEALDLNVKAIQPETFSLNSLFNNYGKTDKKNPEEDKLIKTIKRVFELYHLSQSSHCQDYSPFHRGLNRIQKTNCPPKLTGALKLTDFLTFYLSDDMFRIYYSSSLSLLIKPNDLGQLETESCEPFVHFLLPTDQKLSDEVEDMPPNSKATPLIFSTNSYLVAEVLNSRNKAKTGVILPVRILLFTAEKLPSLSPPCHVFVECQKLENTWGILVTISINFSSFFSLYLRDVRLFPKDFKLFVSLPMPQKTIKFQLISSNPHCNSFSDDGVIEWSLTYADFANVSVYNDINIEFMAIVKTDPLPSVKALNKIVAELNFSLKDSSIWDRTRLFKTLAFNHEEIAKVINLSIKSFCSLG